MVRSATARKQYLPGVVGAVVVADLAHDFPSVLLPLGGTQSALLRVTAVPTWLVVQSGVAAGHR